MSVLDTPLPQRSMTAEEVLAVFRDEHQVFFGASGEDPDTLINFDMTVSDWRYELELLPWKRLGRALNGQFQIQLSVRQWKTVMVPGRSRTLREVCELIASQAKIPEMRSVTVLGRPCRPAGAFLALREGMRLAGLNVTKLRPSTPLAPLLKEHFAEIIPEVIKLAPGRLPPLISKRTLADRLLTYLVFWPLVAGLLTGIVGCGGLWCLPGPLAAVAGYCAVVGWTVFLVEMILALLLGVFLPTTTPEFKNLHDLRDLCYAMLGEEPKRRRTPS